MRLLRTFAATPARPVPSRIIVAGSGTAVKPGAVTVPCPVKLKSNIPGLVSSEAPAAVADPLAMLKIPVPPVIVRFLVNGLNPVTGSGGKFSPVNVPVKESAPAKANVKVPVTGEEPFGFGIVGSIVPIAKKVALPKGETVPVPAATKLTSGGAGVVVTVPLIAQLRVTVSAIAGRAVRASAGNSSANLLMREVMWFIVIDLRVKFMTRVSTGTRHKLRRKAATGQAR